MRVIQPISYEESERRALLQKEWSRYKGAQRVEDNKIIAAIVKAQEKALHELRLESEELYQAAIQIDPQIIPFKAIGPVVTPPIAQYAPPVAYLSNALISYSSRIQFYANSIFYFYFYFLSTGWRLCRH